MVSPDGKYASAQTAMHCDAVMESSPQESQPGIGIAAPGAADANGGTIICVPME
jgi:hypothetical protein